MLVVGLLLHTLRCWKYLENLLRAYGTCLGGLQRAGTDCLQRVPARSFLLDCFVSNLDDALRVWRLAVQKAGEGGTAHHWHDIARLLNGCRLNLISSNQGPFDNLAAFNPQWHSLLWCSSEEIPL